MAQAHAIQIYNIVDKKFVINTNELNPVLDKVGSRRVAVYSICGPLRKGKSFMLSMWLRHLVTGGKGDWVNYQLPNMFTYRPGAVRETTGIYMWSEPFFLQKSNGDEVALLLLDSQGSFDNQTTTQENAIVFALCTLLSSYVVFNLQGQIQEDLLQFIQYFGSYARLADDHNKDEPFQKLLFLIRDFQHVCDYEYGYYDECTYIHGKNYKKDFLNPNNSQPMEVKFVHEMILDTFSEVGVYLMPHPGSKLATRGEFSTGGVEPEFLEHLNKFASVMLQPDALVVKKIGGQVITGVILKALVERWAVLFRSEELPECKTLFEATAEIQHDMAKQAAIDNYSRRFKDAIGNMKGIEASILGDMYREILQESIALFHSFKKVGSDQYGSGYLQTVNEEIAKLFEFYIQINNSYVQLDAIKEESAAQVAVMNAAVSTLKDEFERTDSNNKAERQRLIEEITQKDKRREELENNLNSTVRDLQSQMSRQQQELAEARSMSMSRSTDGPGGGKGGILGILGEVFTVVVGVTNVLSAGSALKGAWKKF